MCQIVRGSGPTMPKEDEPRGIIAPLKENLALVLLALSPGSIIKQINKMKAMSPPELVIYILTTSFWITCLFGSCFLSILGFFLTLMRGSFGQEEKSAKEMQLVNPKKSKIYFQIISGFYQTCKTFADKIAKNTVKKNVKNPEIINQFSEDQKKAFRNPF